MSDENQSPGESDCSDELRQALAAFGDADMSFLDDDDDCEDFSAEMSADQPTTSPSPGKFNHDLAVVAPSDDDVPLIRYVKELNRAIYTGGQPSNQPLRSGATVARYIAFVVGGQQFAVSLKDVSEIGRYPKVTELPGTPSWLRGVANLRGTILSVTDLRNLLNVAGERPTVGEKIIVLHSQQKQGQQNSSRATSTAIVVDHVLGIRNLEGAPGDVNDLKHRVASIASGTARFDQTTTVLIDPGKLFECADLLLTFAS